LPGITVRSQTSAHGRTIRRARCHARDDLNVELTRIWQGTHKTVIFVTHSIVEAVYLSDRIVMVSGRPGRIVNSITIDLPRPRALAMRETPEFGAYTQRIRRHFAELGLLKEA
jgi:NitT/TauT family transport system ATP-binding protein